jgi:hypothetical protein
VNRSFFGSSLAGAALASSTSMAAPRAAGRVSVRQPFARDRRRFAAHTSLAN